MSNSTDPQTVPSPGGSDSPAPAGARRPRRGRRLRRWLLILSVALLLALPLAWVLREPVTHPLLVRAARWAVPRFTPYELELAALHGDWWTGLELEGLELRPQEPASAGADDAPLRLFTADRVGLRWRWRDMLDDPLAGLDALEVGAARLELDLTRLSPEAAAEPPSTGPGFTWPAHLPAVDVGSLSLELTVTADAGLSLAGASLQVVPEGPGGHSAVCRVTRASWEDAVVQATGPLDLDWRAADGRFEFDVVRWQGQPLLEALAVDLTEIGRAVWSVDGTLLLADARSSLRVAGRAEGLELTLASQGLDLAQVGARVGEHLRDWDGTGVAGRVDLEASAQLAYDAPLDGTAELSLVARSVVLLERRAEQLELEASVAEGTARVRRGELREGPNELVVRDLALPLAWSSAENFVRDLDGQLHLEARDLGLWVAAGLMPDRPDVPEHHLVFDADLSGGEASVERGELVLPGGRVLVERGVVSVGDALSGGGLDVDLAGRVDLTDLVPLEGILGSAPWSGSLAGSLALRGRLPALELEVDLTGAELALPWFAPGEVHLLGRADRDGVAVQLLEARGEFGSLGARGALAWQDWTFGEVRLNADIVRPELVPGLGDLTGAWHLEGDLEGPLARIEGGLLLSSEHFQAGGAPFDDVWVDARLTDGGVELQELRATTPAGPLRAAGRATGVFDDRPLGLELDQLLLSEGPQQLRLVAPLRALVSGPRLVVEQFLLEGPAGRVSGAAQLEGEVALVDLELDELDPGAWLDPLLPSGVRLERADARFHLERTGPVFSLDTDGELDLLLQPLPPREESHAVRVAWAGNMAEGRLELQRLTAVEGAPGAPDELGTGELGTGELGTGAEWFALQGGLPLDPFPAADATHFAPGPLNFGGQLALPAGFALELGPNAAVELAEPLSGELALAGTWSALEARLALEGRSLRFRGPEWSAPLLTEPAALDTAFAVDADGLRIERLLLELPGRATVELAGSAGIEPDVVQLLADPRRIEAAPLALDGSAELTLDGALARGLGGVRRLSGYFSGDLQVAGTLGAPVLSSTARLTDGELRLAAAVPTLHGLNAELRLERDQLLLEGFRGEIGGAPFVAHGTLSDLADVPTLELFLEGENLLFARSEGLRVRGDCKLAARGPLDDVLVTGDLALRNSRLSANIDPLAIGGGSGPSRPAGIQLFSLPDPPLSGLRFDIAITTAEPFIVRSNFVSGSLLADLQLGGTGAVPLPVGRIFLQKTRARLPAGTIQLPSGVIEFRSTDPFVPRINIRGETRLAGYDVNLLMRGPYHDPEVLLSSSPPLPNYDLVSLLLTGRVPIDNEGGNVEAATESLALFLARDAFTRNFLGPPGDGESLLDRFEYSTGQEVSRRGSLTTHGSFRMGDDVLRKGDSLYMTGERDKYDEFNFGLKLLFRLR